MPTERRNVQRESGDPVKDLSWLLDEHPNADQYIVFLRDGTKGTGGIAVHATLESQITLVQELVYQNKLLRSLLLMKLLMDAVEE